MTAQESRDTMNTESDCRAGDTNSTALVHASKPDPTSISLNNISKLGWSGIKDITVFYLNTKTFGLLGVLKAVFEAYHAGNRHEEITAHNEAIERRLLDFAERFDQNTENCGLTAENYDEMMKEPRCSRVWTDALRDVTLISDTGTREIFAALLVERLKEYGDSTESLALEGALSALKDINRDCILSMMLVLAVNDSQQFNFENEALCKAVIGILENLSFGEFQVDHLASVGCVVAPGGRFHVKEKGLKRWLWESNMAPLENWLTPFQRNKLEEALNSERLISTRLTGKGRVIAAQAYANEYPDAGISLRIGLRGRLPRS